MWRVDIYEGNECVFWNDYETFALAMHRGKQELAYWERVREIDTLYLEVTWVEEAELVDSFLVEVWEYV